MIMFALQTEEHYILVDIATRVGFCSLMLRTAYGKVLGTSDGTQLLLPVGVGLGDCNGEVLGNVDGSREGILE